MPAQHRFAVPADQALATRADATGAMSALLVLDAHIEHHIAWLSRCVVAIGSDAQDDGPTRDARVMVNVQLEQMRALRRELAELTADADAALPPDAARADELVREPVLPPLPPLPPTHGPLELQLVQQSFSHGMVAFCRDLCTALGPLHERLAAFDDEESRALAQRSRAFLASLRAPAS